MATKCKILCLWLLVLLLCSAAPSDDTLPDQNAESAAKAFTSLADAYNARAPKAIAELFAPKGEFVDAEGNVFQGREAIAREFTALFEINPRNSIDFTMDDVREVSPGVLTVDCVASFPAKEVADDIKVDFTALVVKQANGRWLLASIRSAGERSLRTPHAHLKQLEWLIGEWVDESAESTMQTSSRWSEDGNFIVTTFAIHVAGRKVMTGTQWIGWDGSLDKFRSWVFDSEGGHAEGIWTEIDGRWVVKSTGVRPDGDACSATQTYEQKGADAYLFSVKDRIIEDETQPDFTAQVVRKPPEPKSASNANSTPRGK